MENTAAPTLAFDVYGTLIDTHGLLSMLQPVAGDRAMALSMLWRQKQLEYSFRRALMRKYRPFSECTAEALEFACTAIGIELPSEARAGLLQEYLRLPAFSDVARGLRLAREAGFRLYAFSNGTADDVAGLLSHAGLIEWFIDIVSVDEIGSFKPDPAVYRHFLNRAGCSAKNTWLVSSNPFDVTGACAAGMSAIWVQRTPLPPFDPWEFKPAATVGSLVDVAQAVSAGA